MKYKVGDRVIIEQHRTEYMSGSGGMDKYLGKIMTIQIVRARGYIMAEDLGKWYWEEEFIDHIATKYLGKTASSTEQTILINLPQQFKYIARDKNNRIWLYTMLPVKNNTKWAHGGDVVELAFPHLFGFVRWEDSAAQEIVNLIQ